jgi:hypothetical protein
MLKLLLENGDTYVIEDYDMTQFDQSIEQGWEYFDVKEQMIIVVSHNSDEALCIRVHHQKIRKTSIIFVEEIPENFNTYETFKNLFDDYREKTGLYEVQLVDENDKDNNEEKVESEEEIILN